MKKKHLLLGILPVLTVSLMMGGPQRVYAYDTSEFDEVEYNGALADHCEQTLIAKDQIDEALAHIDSD